MGIDSPIARPRQERLFILMLRIVSLVLTLLLCLASARAERVALTGGTVINPGDGKTIPDATILIDGKVIEAPIVRWKISDGAHISGDFTKEEAEAIARSLTGRR